MAINYLKKLLKPKIRKSQTFFELSYISSDEFTNNKATIDAYNSNVIVYRCVNLIAQSASHVPWLVMKSKNGNNHILNDHPAYHLLKKPNSEKAGADFFGEIIASKLLFGNAYIVSSTIKNGPPKEIYLLHAPSIEIILNNQNQAVAYEYRSGNGQKNYHIDNLTRMSKILHLRNYNPSNSYYGLSCLEAASIPINIHLHTSKWNNSLLKNGARPSGALIIEDGGGYLTDEQFERLQEQIYEKFSGSNKSGKPLVLEGGMKWQEMSINPKDMDFIESKNSAAREIALAFGVPPQLLGIRGDNTYSNMQEARLALWEETLIPLLDKISDAFSNWLSYWYQDEIIIDFDRDKISALTEKRENLWAKIANANFMTINEKRAFVGLKPIGNGDNL